MNFWAISSIKIHMNHSSSNLSLIEKCTIVSCTTTEEKLEHAINYGKDFKNFLKFILV